MTDMTMTRGKINWRKYNKRYKRARRAARAERIILTAGMALLFALVLKLIVGHAFGMDGTTVSLADVQAMRVPQTALAELKAEAEKRRVPFAEALAVFAVENRFFPEKNADISMSGTMAEFMERFGKTKRAYSQSALKPYINMFGGVLSEIKRFPVEQAGEYTYGDSWGSPRTEGTAEGAARGHEGCDVLDNENTRGRLSVVSMTDGEVTGMGWNDLGGFYVDVTGKSGNCYYYAHLDRFADGLAKGAKIRAGDMIGSMGDTGYGKEGTRGQFPTHLHVGIMPAKTITDKEFWINPYPFLAMVEANGGK